MRRTAAFCIQQLFLQELEKAIWETKRPSDRDSLLSELDGYRSQIEANYGSLRKANTSSRKSIEEKTKNELLSLSYEREDETDVRRRRVPKDGLAQKASNVTEDLLSISRMMAGQVAQSEHTLGALVNSSATVTETQEEFKTMGNLLIQSRKLLFKYGRREITDKVLIFIALAFFFACVLYVVTKRLF